MQKLRNIAIIAHVDHGKTTLVDKMIVAGTGVLDCPLHKTTNLIPPQQVIFCFRMGAFAPLNFYK